MDYQQAFESRLAKLNEEQRQAVQKTEGPVMVVAGPGTGKTEIMGMRVAYIVKETGTDPRAILLMTFTDSGVQALRKRLLEIMGPDAYKVNIATFHSFCGQVISEFPEAFLFAKNMRQISDIEKIELIRRFIDETPLKLLKPFGDKYFYVRDILSCISQLKRENVSPAKFEEVLKHEEEQLQAEHTINKRTGKPPVIWRNKEKQVNKNKELAVLYRQYEEYVKKEGLYDFDDMILFVVDKFKHNEDVLAYYQEQYLYLLVDEYQDTNTAQNEIIKLLTSYEYDEQPNVFVVGDDDQSIYRFQGASLENILFFHKHYNIAEPVVLKKNYRSHQLLLDASRSAIEKNIGRISTHLPNVTKHLEAHKGEGEQIEEYLFHGDEAERYFVAEKITGLLRQGVSPSEIAVIVRTNREVESIASYLAKKHIPIVFAGNQDVLRSPIVSLFLEYLKVIANPYNDIALVTVLSSPLGNVPMADIFRLNKALSDHNYGKKKPMHLYSLVKNAELLEQVDIAHKEQLLHAIDTIETNATLQTTSTFADFIEEVYATSGLLQWAYEHGNAITYMHQLSSFLKEVRSLNEVDKQLQLPVFLEKMHLYQEYGIKIGEEPFLVEKEGVQIMTAHKSKGLEFEYVFIVQCIDKNWGNRRSFEKITLVPSVLERIGANDQSDSNEDERRLFYVALTRAKKKAFLTYAEEYGVGSSAKKASPSQFIPEAKEQEGTVRQEVMEDQTVDPKEYLKEKLTVNKEGNLSEDDYLRGVLLEYKLSPSHLDSYEYCPRKFKFDYLLRFPQPKNKHLVLGTAYHAALERFMIDYKKLGKLPTKEQLLTYYTEALDKEVLPFEEKQECLDLGREGLAGYFDLYEHTFEKPELVEYNFSSRQIYLDEKIHLTGKVDKIEKVGGDDRAVRIVDYKTGRTKSDGEIAGTTKFSDGAYKRQLLFYKLLCDLDPHLSKTYDIQECQIDFVQGKDGKYRKATIEYTVEDIEQLKGEIRDVWRGIQALEFPMTDDKKHCDGCPYYKLCYGPTKE